MASCPAILLPVIRLREMDSLIAALPASARAEASWNARQVRRHLEAMQAMTWSLPELDAMIREFLTSHMALLRALLAQDSLLRGLADGCESRLRDTAAMVPSTLGPTIAGAAATYALRALRALFRYLAEHAGLVAEVTEELTEKLGDPELLAQSVSDSWTQGSPTTRDFIRGEITTIALDDALVALPTAADPSGIPRERLAKIGQLACFAAQRFLRGIADPAWTSLGDPFFGESSEQRDSRLLTYIRLAPLAADEVESEVIRGLRIHAAPAGASHLDTIASLFGDTLRRLA